MQSMSRRVVLLIAAVIVAYVLPDRALAQGTGGTIPEPMGLREASELIGRRVSLDGPARRAIETAHDRYLESFARFRDAEVQDFLGTMQRVQASSNGRMPELTLLDEFLEEWRDVVKRVATIDDAFFAEIAAALPPDGVDGLDRARRVRARQRHLGSMGGMMGGLGGVGTLDTAFWNLQPTPEEIAACDAALRSYERVMPGHAEKIAEATVGTIRMIAAMLTEQGFGDIGPEDMQDPERMQQMMAAVQSAMAAASGALFEATDDAEKAEIAAASGLKRGISPERWWRLKRAWMSSAFPMAGIGWMSGPETAVPRYAELVLEAVEDPEARESVLAVRNAWFATDDRLTDELIEAGRAFMARQMQGDFMAGFDGGSDPMQETREERTAAAQSTIDRMLSFIENDATRQDLQVRIDAEPPSFMQGGVEIPIATEAGEEPADTRWEDRAGTSRMAPGVPMPIAQDEFSLMMAMLGLDEQERTIAQVMLDDQLDAWGSTIDPIIERAYARPIYTEDGRPDIGAHESQWSDFRDAVVASRGLDEAFVTELEAAFGRADRTDAFEAVRIQRAFDRMASIADSRFDNAFGVPVVEPTSPYTVLDDLAVTDDVRAEAMSAAIAAAGELRAAVEGWEDLRFDQDRRTALEQMRLAVRMRELESLPQETQMAEAAALGMAQMEPYLRQFESRRSEASRRRKVIETVLATRVVPTLPPLAALELRVALLDAGRPVNDEGGTALEVAQQVLRLRDLEEGQTAIIESLLQDHLEVEIGLVEAMAAAGARLETLDSRDMAEIMQRQEAMRQEIEKSRFRRRELGERLLARLLDVLSADQVARIPALSERSGG
jgi:hypothetical protein